MTIAYGILIFFSLLAYLEMRTRLHHGCLIRLISLHLYYTFRTNVHSLDFLFVYVYLVGLFVCFESMQGILFFLHFFFIPLQHSLFCQCFYWVPLNAIRLCPNVSQLWTYQRAHTHTPKRGESNDYRVVLHMRILSGSRKMRFNCVTRDRIDMHYCDASQNNDTNHNLYKGRMALFHMPISNGFFLLLSHCAPTLMNLYPM